jgi:hypothetical protein
VTTAEYGSQMLSLGGVHHLTGGSKKEGVVTCDSLLALANGRAVEMTVDGGAKVVVQSGKPPIVNDLPEHRMRVGCGSATIGMFAKQWHGHVDEVIVVDDHITGVLSEHQAGRFLDMKPAGIRVRGRKSTPGRYFQVAAPGTGWGGTDIADPLTIVEKIDPKTAWPGLRLLMVSTTGEHSAWFVLDANLKPVPADMPAPIKKVVDRIGENCEPALVHRAVHGRGGRFVARRRDREPGAADQFGAREFDARHLGRRTGLCLAGRGHHLHGRRREHARQRLRLRAHARVGGAAGIHHAPRRLREARRTHGPYPADRIACRGGAGGGVRLAVGTSLAPDPVGESLAPCRFCPTEAACI